MRKILLTAIIHKDNVFCGERLLCDVVSSEVAAHIDTTTVLGCQYVTEIPSNDVGEIIRARAILIRPVLVWPARERLIVNVGVCPIVPGRNYNIRGCVIQTQGSWHLSRIPANFLAYQVERFMSPEPRSSIREDLREKLFKDIVAL